ncbi:MAG: L,D-transpeptidase [Prochlorococcaceae cyanobacterium]
MLELVASLLIDLSKQRLTAYGASRQPIYSALVSTGLPSTPTPSGQFTIGAKYSRTTLTGATYRTPPVPDVICLAGGGLKPDAICIHPAPWQEAAGQCFGVTRSHGCIRTSRATARWLFQHTRIGTPVTIQP